MTALGALLIYVALAAACWALVAAAVAAAKPRR